jgi:hypothetical protein
MLPRDRPVAAGPGWAFPVTAAEQSWPESPSARHTREQSDFGELGYPEGEPTAPAGEAAGEEAAMEVMSEDDFPAGEDSAD